MTTTGMVGDPRRVPDITGRPTRYDEGPWFFVDDDGKK